MSPLVHHLEGHLPWGNGGSPEIPQKDEAPRKAVAFTCEREHHFVLNFAAGAEVPDDWDCRCGKPARRDGAPESTRGKARPVMPGMGKYERAGSDVTPMGQLKKRRSKKQGEAILAEALERVRQTGASR